MRSRGLGPDLSLMFDDQSSDRGGSTVELEQADTSASFTGDVHATAFADVEVCTEVVADAEPVAHIDHLEAKQIADQLWATWIERTSRGGVSQGTDRSKAVLLVFGRCPREFDEVLLACQVAKRLAARGVDIRPAWANGAKILVEGVLPEHVDKPLDSKHVVVHIKDEADVWHALGGLPYRFVHDDLRARGVPTSTIPNHMKTWRLACPSRWVWFGLGRIGSGQATPNRQSLSLTLKVMLVVILHSQRRRIGVGARKILAI